MNRGIGGVQPANLPLIIGGLDMPSGIIGGDMGFQGGGASFGGAIGGGVGGAYTSAYNSALSQNQQAYGNILQGYQQTMGGQQQNQASIQQRYDNLGGQVMGTIAGVGQSQQQAIQDQYAQASGASSQNLINSGLGNSTVLSSVQRGNTLDEQKAQIALANQMAQLSAGYQAQLGSQSAGYANQSNMQNTALAGQQLGFMNSVSMQYPNAQSYQNLLAYQGAQGQMNAWNAAHPFQGVPGAGGGGGPFPPQAPGGQGPQATPQPGGFGGGGSNFGGGYYPGIQGAAAAYGASPGNYGQAQPVGNYAMAGGSNYGGYAGTNQDYLTDPNYGGGGGDFASA